MKYRNIVQVVAVVVVGVFAVGIWSTGGHVHLAWLRFYSAAVFAATLLLWVWENLAWRIPLAQRTRWVPRNVRGTWRGTLASSWVDPQTGQALEPKRAYLVIRQTATSVLVVLLTDESRSVSTFAAVMDGPGIAALDYMYLNRPDNRVQGRSRMHHGSTSLDITGRPAMRLRGHYWTDRDTRGDLDFGERVSKTADDFDSAEALF